MRPIRPDSVRAGCLGRREARPVTSRSIDRGSGAGARWDWTRSPSARSRATLSASGPRSEGECEIGVLACNDARIDGAERRFPRQAAARPTCCAGPPRSVARRRAGETPRRRRIRDDPELGDIAIAYETCAAEARDRAQTAGRSCHASDRSRMLHLLGYDHVRDARCHADGRRSRLRYLANWAWRTHIA